MLHGVSAVCGAFATNRIRPAAGPVARRDGRVARATQESGGNDAARRSLALPGRGIDRMRIFVGYGKGFVISHLRIEAYR